MFGAGRYDYFVMYVFLLCYCCLYRDVQTGQVDDGSRSVESLRLFIQPERYSGSFKSLHQNKCGNRRTFDSKHLKDHVTLHINTVLIMNK